MTKWLKNNKTGLFFFVSWLRLFLVYFFNQFILIGGWLQYCGGFCHTLTWISHGGMCPPSWNPLLLPPTPSHPSRWYQCTDFECPVSYIKPGLVIYFIYGNIHVSMLFSQIIPPLPSPTESKSLFFICVSFLSRVYGHHYHLSKFHIYALLYCIGVFLSDLLHSV